MSKVTSKLFSHTHYSVSTAAAVLYAAVWFFGMRAHAEPQIESTLLPAVVVTAQRISNTVLDPVVVTARRINNATGVMLEPVVVLAKREPVTVAEARVEPATSSGSIGSAGSYGQKKGMIAKMRSWFGNRLL